MNNNLNSNITSKYYTCLICDIGGTNSRMSLVKLSKNKQDKCTKIDQKKLKSPDYSSLCNLLVSYLSPFVGSDNYPQIALLAIPGPVRHNKVSIIANLLHWPEGNGEELEKHLNIKKVILLNDFVAIGYGVSTNLELNKNYYNINYNFSNFHNKSNASSNSKLDINEIDHENGTYICIGAGTGLGHCIGYKTDHLYSIKKPFNIVDKDNPSYYVYHDVIPSEGGHQTFSPYNDNEYNYKKYITNLLNIDHVSHERLCSGPAIPYMYNFYLEKIINANNKYRDLDSNINLKEVEDYNNIIPKLINIKSNDFNKKRWELTPEEIVKSAVNEDCPVSILVRNMFLEILATECSNFSLATLPYKGLFLVGSITNAFKDYLLTNKNNVFVERFFNKGRLSDFLYKLPIYLVTEENIGMIGCMEYARRIIESLVI